MAKRFTLRGLAGAVLCFVLAVALVGCSAPEPGAEKVEQQTNADPMLANFEVDGFSVEGIEDVSQFGGYAAKIIGFGGTPDAKAVLYLPTNVDVTPDATAAQTKNLVVKGVSGISGYKSLIVTDLPDSTGVNTPGQFLYDRNLTFNPVDSNGDGNVDALEVVGDKPLTLASELLAEHPLLTKLKYDQLPTERFGLPVTAADSFIDTKIAGFKKTVNASADAKAAKAAIKKLEKFKEYLNKPTDYASKKIKSLTKSANTLLTDYEKAMAAPQTVTLTINMGKRGVNCPELYFVKDGKQTLVQAVSKWIIDGKQVSSNTVFDKYFFADDWDASEHTVTVVMSTTLKAGTYSVKFTGGGAQKTLGSITVAGKPVVASFTY
jgi:hypothetical protein